MLSELKKQHLGVEGDLSRVQKLILERDVEIQRIDYRQPEHLVSKQKREIKSTYADKMFAEARKAHERGLAAETALDRLTPPALEEAADFSNPADESAWTLRVQLSKPGALRELACRANRESNRALARVIRRETTGREDLSRDTLDTITDELNEIPISQQAFECANLALEIFKQAQMVQFESELKTDLSRHLKNWLLLAGSVQRLRKSRRGVSPSSNRSSPNQKPKIPSQ